MLLAFAPAPQNGQKIIQLILKKNGLVDVDCQMNLIFPKNKTKDIFWWDMVRGSDLVVTAVGKEEKQQKVL
ncbi:MAG: hypothetical protein Ct9H90mP6_12330 [Gammaproteobacteria bacterium]|nr:MAG: hypothetical protein Ct9H90mP6_12330 [Gammaproteobacteria bacterium]